MSAERRIARSFFIFVTFRNVPATCGVAVFVDSTAIHAVGYLYYTIFSPCCQPYSYKLRINFDLRSAEFISFVYPGFCLCNCAVATASRLAAVGSLPLTARGEKYSVVRFWLAVGASVSKTFRMACVGCFSFVLMEKNGVSMCGTHVCDYR